jgi:hypothetical protein
MFLLSRSSFALVSYSSGLFFSSRLRRCLLKHVALRPVGTRARRLLVWFDAAALQRWFQPQCAVPREALHLAWLMFDWWLSKLRLLSFNSSLGFHQLICPPPRTPFSTEPRGLQHIICSNDDEAIVKSRPEKKIGTGG